MSDAQAYAELDRRKILYTRVDVAPGVRAPIRLTGRLHGVYIHSSIPLERRGQSPFEILDARLALALDDFAALLARHDVDELVHFTMYRPNVARPTRRAKRTAGPAPAGTTTSRGSTAAPGTRHPAGLAIDVGSIRKRDGRWLTVGSHFRGQIGAKTCGPGASVPDDDRARQLRAIVCEAASRGIFTYILTPNYDAAHADHFHMEVRPQVRWFLVH